jgi:hypothetical protein
MILVKTNHPYLRVGCHNSSFELNTRKVGNSPRFLLVTYSASSNKWFRSYGILYIDNTAEICLGQNNS